LAKIIAATFARCKESLMNRAVNSFPLITAKTGDMRIINLPKGVTIKHSKTDCLHPAAACV